jgi:hypothetical protein
MTFKPGICPNPAGRPKGSGYKQMLFNEKIMPHAEQIIAKAIEMANDGNDNMIKFMLERIVPRPQDNPAPFAISEKVSEESLIKASEGVIKLVSEGNLLPEEGKIITEMLKSHRDSMMLQTLMDKLTNLQAKVDGMGK